MHGRHFFAIFGLEMFKTRRDVITQCRQYFLFDDILLKFLDLLDDIFREFHSHIT